jgi:hypothetical protein
MGAGERFEVAGQWTIPEITGGSEVNVVNRVNQVNKIIWLSL